LDRKLKEENIFAINVELKIVHTEQNARKGLQIADVGVVLDLGTNSFEAPACDVLQDPRIQELYLGKRHHAVAAEGCK